MTTGSALLSALDAALPASAAQVQGPARTEQQQAGLLAAVGLTKLLVARGRNWDDVMLQRGTRLAKLCGRLGSHFAGEQAAAYIHATRLLHRTGARWSNLVRLPPDLAEGMLALSLPVLVLPPEDDWLTTIRVLQQQGMPHADADLALLQSLTARLEDGQAIDSGEARRLREMWWSAEVNRPTDRSAAG